MNNRLTHLGKTSLVLYKRENDAVYMRIIENVSAHRQNVNACIAEFMQESDLNTCLQLVELKEIEKTIWQKTAAVLTGFCEGKQYETLPDTQMVFRLDLEEPGEVAQLSQAIGKYAADPSMTFLWEDAAIISKHLRKYAAHIPNAPDSPQIQE